MLNDTTVGEASKSQCVGSSGGALLEEWPMDQQQGGHLGIGEESQAPADPLNQKPLVGAGSCLSKPFRCGRGGNQQVKKN